MRWFIIPAVAAAALTFAAPSPAKAQIVIGGYPGYSSYYGGYGGYGGYPYGGLSIGNGGLINLGLSLALSSLNGGYGNYGGYYPGGYGGYYPSYYPSYYGGLGGYRTYSYPSYYRNWGDYGYGNRGYKGGRGHGRGHR